MNDIHALIKNTFLLSLLLFLLGNGITYWGLMKGEQLAIDLSRPSGATSWSTSPEQIAATQNAIAIFGISIIILALIIFAITFYYWFTTKLKELS